MPSLATTLMGFGVGLGVLVEAVGLAGTGSLWELPLLAVVLYWASRWVSDIRYRWTRLAGVL